MDADNIDTTEFSIYETYDLVEDRNTIGGVIDIDSFLNIMEQYSKLYPPSIFVLFIKHSMWEDLISREFDAISPGSTYELVSKGFVGIFELGNSRAIIYTDAFANREELQFLPKEIVLYLIPMRSTPESESEAA